MQRSRAYENLDNRFGEVRTLLALCSSPSTDPSEHRQRLAADAAVLRGALVLLCSHVEGFFEELAEDVLMAFDKQAPSVEKIPLIIRQKQVTSLLRIENSPDLQRDWNGLLRCVSHPLLYDHNPCPPGRRNIDPLLHIKGFANPSTVNIANLMTSIGIQNCWAIVERHMNNKGGRHVIDALVNRRNQIAHGNLESSVAVSDVEGYICMLEKVCERFDLIAHCHLTQCIGFDVAWPR